MFCFNCFKEVGSNDPCPYCGYDGKSDSEKYPQALPCGSILNGRYTVGRVLGQGGFGITYIAQDYKTKELVAIKEYLPSDYSNRAIGTHRLTVYSGERTEFFEYGRQKFMEEAKTLSQFSSNENICKVYRYFEENGTAYIVMEYIAGISLDKYIASHGGKLSVEESCRLLMPIMDALICVHSEGLIHRDIAPDNIIVTAEGNAKLIDFGAARYNMGKKTHSFTVILKHGFAPMEQYSRQGEQGAYTDVYALSATFYYALTGKIPPDAIDRINDDSLHNPENLCSGISSEFNAALLKGLSVKSTDRYQNIADMKSALDAAIAHRTIPGHEPQPRPDPIVPSTHIWKILVALVATLAVVASLVVCIVTLTGNSESEPEHVIEYVPIYVTPEPTITDKPEIKHSSKLATDISAPTQTPIVLRKTIATNVSRDNREWMDDQGWQHYFCGTRLNYNILKTGEVKNCYSFHMEYSSTVRNPECGKDATGTRIVYVRDKENEDANNDSAWIEVGRFSYNSESGETISVDINWDDTIGPLNVYSMAAVMEKDMTGASFSANWGDYITLYSYE